MPNQPRAANQPDGLTGTAVETFGATNDVRRNQNVPEKAANAAAELGKLGGEARARKLPAAQRAEIARKAAAARWRKVRNDVPPAAASYTRRPKD